MKPRFITLDGIDGAGKSTNLAVMKAWFEKHQLPVLFTREPGGTPAGEALREILLNPATQVSLRTETLLMFAARQQHLETVILPALKTARMSFPTALPMQRLPIKAADEAFPCKILPRLSIGCRVISAQI